jgi:hypothetical protein
MLFPLLQCLDDQGRCLRPPEAATEEDGNQGVVPLTHQTSVIEGGKKSLPLFSGQPIADPDAVLLDTLDSAGSGREIEAQKPTVRRPHTQAAESPPGGG